MTNLTLTNIIQLNGTLEVKSGLRIGAGDSQMHIGGTDLTVIRNPITNDPFIPGSSIKGKIRSLLEQASGLMGVTQGNVINWDHYKNETNPQRKKYALAIIKLFGMSGADKVDPSESPGASRLVFSDLQLNSKWKENAYKNGWMLTEVKTENSINRIQGTAENPRQIERVPAGSEFDFDIRCKIFDKDDESIFDTYLLSGLKILEMDYLGGMGSRGYGKVSFQFQDEKTSAKFKNLDPFKTLGLIS